MITPEWWICIVRLGYYLHTEATAHSKWRKWSHPHHNHVTVTNMVMIQPSAFSESLSDLHSITTQCNYSLPFTHALSRTYLMYGLAAASMFFWTGISSSSITKTASWKHCSSWKDRRADRIFRECCGSDTTEPRRLDSEVFDIMQFN